MNMDRCDGDNSEGNSCKCRIPMTMNNLFVNYMCVRCNHGIEFHPTGAVPEAKQGFNENPDVNVINIQCGRYIDRTNAIIEGFDNAQQNRLAEFEALALSKLDEKTTLDDAVPASESESDLSDAKVCQDVLYRARPGLTVAQASNEKDMSCVTLDDLENRIRYQSCTSSGMEPFVVCADRVQLVEGILNLSYDWLVITYVSQNELPEKILQSCLDETLNLLVKVLNIDVHFRDATGKPKLYCLPDMQNDYVASDSLLRADQFFKGKTDLIGESSSETPTPLGFLELKRYLKKLTQRYQLALQLTGARQAGEASDTPFLPMGILTSVSSMEILQFDFDDRSKVHVQDVLHVDANNVTICEEGNEALPCARKSFQNNILVMLSVMSHQLKLDSSFTSDEGKQGVDLSDGEVGDNDGGSYNAKPPRSPQKPTANHSSRLSGGSDKGYANDAENVEPVRLRKRGWRQAKKNALREKLRSQATEVEEEVRLARREFADMYNLG